MKLNETKWNEINQTQNRKYFDLLFHFVNQNYFRQKYVIRLFVMPQFVIQIIKDQQSKSLQNTMRSRAMQAEHDMDMSLQKNAMETFSQFKQQIALIAKQSRQKQQLHKVQSRVMSLKSKPEQRPASASTPLLNNIILDYLRSTQRNYTYSIFMQQSNTIPQEVVSKSKLAVVLGLSKQYQSQERFDVSIVQLMTRVIEQLGRKKQEMVDSAIQCQFVKRDGSQNYGLVIENRLREVREEVESRQRKYYEKMLESMRAREILQLRAEISTQMQQKMRKQRQKQQKQFQQLIKKNPESHKLTMLESENASLTSQCHNLVRKVSGLTAQVQGLKKQNKQHNCKKSDEYKLLEGKMEQERKQLEGKKKQLDYALRNVNTKIQDLVQKKAKIEGNLKSDAFADGVRKGKENKDYLIQTVYAEMKRMEQRVKVVAGDNEALRIKVRELNGKGKQLQDYCKKLEQQNFELQSRQASSQSKKQLKPNSNKAVSELERKPNQGALIKPVGVEKLNVSIGVRQHDIDAELKNKQKKQQEVKQEDDDEDDYEFENRQLEHDKKLIGIQAEMNLIRKKVLMLADIYDY